MTDSPLSPLSPLSALSPVLQSTRASWNHATRQHNAHKIAQAQWLAAGDHSTLFPEEIDLVRSVLPHSVPTHSVLPQTEHTFAGVSMLHILCNSGQDTLSWAKLGAQVTGVDLSDEAIQFARQLSHDSGIPATFIQSEALAYLENPTGETVETFDVIFGSYGCLCWIADLPRFFAAIRKRLKAGGHAVFLEFHPLVWSFDRQFIPQRDSYFDKGPYPDPVRDYVAAAEGALSPSGHQEIIPDEIAAENPHVAYGWQHTTAEIITAMAQAGLSIKQVCEYPYSNGCKVMEGLVLDSQNTPHPQRYVMPEGYASLPLMLGVTAGGL